MGILNNEVMENYFRNKSYYVLIDWCAYILALCALISLIYAYPTIKANISKPRAPRKIPTEKLIQISATPTPGVPPELPVSLHFLNVYTNTKYHFSFTYPKGWKYDDESEKGLGLGEERVKGGYQLLLYKQEGASIISMLIYNKNNYAYFSENTSDYYTQKDQIKKTTLEINGLDVETIHHKGCPSNDDCISVFFKKGNNIYSFDMRDWTNRYSNLEITYDLISSMQFDKNIPQWNGSETGEGFTVYYPSNFEFGLSRHSLHEKHDSYRPVGDLFNDNMDVSFIVEDNPQNWSVNQKLNYIKQREKAECEIECSDYSENPKELLVHNNTAVLQHIRSVISTSSLLIRLNNGNILTANAVNKQNGFAYAGHDINEIDYPTQEVTDALVDIVDNIIFEKSN